MSYLQHNDLCAWVSIGNVALNHHNIELSPDGRSVTCWIPSEAGKHFSVNWADMRYTRTITTAGWVKVDGHHAGSKFISTTNQSPIVSVAEVITSPTTSRPFIFWPLDLTEDDTYLNGMPGQRPGEITLDIWSVILGNQHYTQGTPVPQPMKVHEKSKGGVAHCTRFGPEIYTPPTVSISSRRVAHLATFIFKYRSLDMLRANGIAPREPQVRAAEVPDSQSGVSVDNEDADEEELRVLQEKIDALRARMARSGPKRIKVEGSS